jgi:hypothetical protein
MYGGVGGVRLRSLPLSRYKVLIELEDANQSQLTSDYVVANGIHLPTKRRAYTRGPDRRPILEMLMVSTDLSEVQFE